MAGKSDFNVTPILLFLPCLALALLAVNKFGAWSNADTIVWSLISIQRPTLFYWSQNRFAALLPLILSGIKDNYTNLFLLLLLNGIVFFLLILSVSLFVVRHVFRKSNALDVALCFTVMAAAFLAAMTPFASFTFIIDAQPYPLSYLLLVAAAFAFFLWERRWFALAVSPICLFWAVGVNSGIVVAGVFIAVIAAWFRDYAKATVFFCLCLLIFAVWHVIASYYKSYPVSYYGIDLAHFGNNLAISGASMSSVLRLGVVLALIGAAAAAVILQTHHSRLFFFMACCCSFAVLWWVVFAQNTWVHANGMHFRYFFSVLFCFGATVAAAIAGYLVERALWLKRGLIALLSLAMGVYLVEPIHPLSAYPVFASVQDQVNFARDHRIRYIAGDYWQAWPAVFMLLDEPTAAFGLTARGDSNRKNFTKAINADCREHRPVSALCLNQPPAECLASARWISGQTWKASEATCPGSCSVISLDPSPAQPCGG